MSGRKPGVGVEGGCGESPLLLRGKGYGVLMDLLLGLVGAVVGGFVFGLLGLHAYGLVGQLVIATAGAVMLIWLVRRL